MGFCSLGLATLGVFWSVLDSVKSPDSINAKHFGIPLPIQQLLTQNWLRLVAMALKCF